MSKCDCDCSFCKKGGKGKWCIHWKAVDIEEKIYSVLDALLLKKITLDEALKKIVALHE